MIMTPKRYTRFIDLGRISFREAWDIQEQLLKQIVDIKLKNQSLPPAQHQSVTNYLIFCEHDHVYTLGKSGSQNNLLINTDQLKAAGAEFLHVNRGGDITYHGPGQIVAYPVLNLEDFVKGVKEYVFKLEEAVIITLAEYDLRGERMNGATGVWLDTDSPGKTRKICAIGVRTSRWVSMHGLAFNINTDLSFFRNINPCGFTDKDVTSLSRELGAAIDQEEVAQRLRLALTKTLGLIPE